jgi:ketosteroid isomerase-like protein
MGKSTLGGFVLTILVAMIPVPVTADTGDDIERLEQKRTQALLAGDMATLDVLYANEFSYNRAGGDSMTKADFFAFFTSGDAKLRRLVVEGMNIRVYGDAAVVTGIQHIDVNLKGEDRKIDLRYLHVWINGPNGWKLVARQATNLPAQN